MVESGINRESRWHMETPAVLMALIATRKRKRVMGLKMKKQIEI
jgi:hypothetical protein